MSNKKKVAVLGGGIGGLSAAHELIERGFEVEVYECRQIPGGKARSFEFRPDGQGEDWNRGLPSEHGFRFFPGFYRHIIDTMERIDDFDRGEKVADNLVPAKEFGVAAYEKKLIKLPANLTPTFDGAMKFLRQYKEALGPPLLTDEDIGCYAGKIWQILTSCQERRIAEYEKIGWKQFIDADDPARSPNYYKYFGKLARSLVAADPDHGSAKTIGDIMVQLYLDISRVGVHFDRLLNGPTNEVFIHPWLKHLLNRGCKYYLNTAVEKIHCKDRRIARVTIKEETRWQQSRCQERGCPEGCAQGICWKKDNCRKKAIRVLDCDRYDITEYEALFPDPDQVRTLEVDADYFVSALPVEVIAEHLNNELLKADPTLKNLRTLANDTAWMNGLLFYLKNDPPIVKGHTVYVDPPWALTSISQLQFWRNDVNIGDYGAGDVAGILSVDISNWEHPDRPAKDLSRSEVISGSWDYLKQSLNTDQQRIKDEYLYASLDPAIEEVLHYRQLLAEALGNPEDPKNSAETLSEEALVLQEKYKERLKNLEPLLINKINTWSLRPTAHTRIENFFLASDYVRTNTDLASMEAANEAARRAVNGILDNSRSATRKCRIWNTHEPWILAPYHWIDKRRFDQGLPWQRHMPFYIRILVYLWNRISMATVRPRRWLRKVKKSYVDKLRQRNR